MKLLLESWREFLKEGEKEKQMFVNSLEEVVEIIQQNPKQDISIDRPKNKWKNFGGKKKRKMPFHYGEYTEILNPSDGMGWDLAIVPSSPEGPEGFIPEEPLLPVGHAKYSREHESKIGNDKIILAPNKKYNEDDIKIIENFFDSIGLFEPVVWY